MRVLIIDDDNFIRTIYKSAFNQENIDVQTASKAEDGFMLAKKDKPDLILLDMILPGMSGFELLDKLKTEDELKDIPVVVFSSLSQQSDIDDAKKLGAAKYLPKDQYQPQQIIEEVKKLVS